MSKSIVVLSGGIGGARFVQGIRWVRPDANVSVVANTADDLWICGVRVCPDLDSLMYTLGDGIDPDRRWGRRDETWHAKEDLMAYGHSEAWFGLGDRDLATHLIRTEALRSGKKLTEVTQLLCERWETGVRLLPMTDSEVATTLDVIDEHGPRTVHFQEYWVRLGAQVEFSALRFEGIDTALPTQEVLVAVADADWILLAPSNPIVSIQPILSVPGLREALRAARAPVIGVSPLIGGGHVRGMADQLMTGLGLETNAAAVAKLHGARSADGVLDGWLVDTCDAELVGVIERAGIAARAVPLYMDDEKTTAQLAQEALSLAAELENA